MSDKVYPEGVTAMDHVNHDMKMGRFPNQSSVETFLKEREVLAAQEKVGHLPDLQRGAGEAIGLTQAARDVLAERRRQVEDERWTPEHDDAHDQGEMASAAGCYALRNGCGVVLASNGVPTDWPWDNAWWKPGDRRRDLVKAGALILAEIERLDRASS